MFKMLPIRVSTKGGHGERHAVVKSKDPRTIESSKTELNLINSSAVVKVKIEKKI